MVVLEENLIGYSEIVLFKMVDVVENLVRGLDYLDNEIEVIINIKEILYFNGEDNVKFNDGDVDKFVVDIEEDFFKVEDLDI